MTRNKVNENRMKKEMQGHTLKLGYLHETTETLQEKI